MLFKKRTPWENTPSDEPINPETERQNALNYIAELSAQEKKAFMEAADLIWLGYEKLRELERTKTNGEPTLASPLTLHSTPTPTLDNDKETMDYEPTQN